MRQTGIANLPLHGGKAPAWLFQRMVRLGGEIARLIVEDAGPEALLARISDPFWFQSLGCVLGFDWHSSGVTTTVCGALKEALRGRERDFGLLIAGGKGAASRKTPAEIVAAGERFALARSPQELVYLSRLTAKIDNNAIQDGFQLYHHNFFFTLSGSWAVVQQGMSGRFARRYHWHSEKVDRLTVDPHSAICSSVEKERVLNLVAAESVPAQKIITALAREAPGKIAREIEAMQHLSLPPHHGISAKDLRPASIEKVLLKTYEAKAADFESLLALPGVGAKTLRALALIAEVAYGTPASWKDPAKFSFAHGGKDGYPYPVNREVYDRSIEILRRSVERAKLAPTEKNDALKRLAAFCS
ncbi:MAG TPA: DUF763 domain-containing protein [Candidatus Acidoferrales bacterium]|nr:DUF763 domain-containing protein [Candidatus Acidoferrales bacterium]